MGLVPVSVLKRPAHSARWLRFQRTVDWLKQDDPGAIVWDEVVGYLVTMIDAPKGWLWIVLGFILFRFFDIVKPWPVSLADKKLHGGLGIMLDDVIAGILSLMVIHLWIILSTPA